MWSIRRSHLQSGTLSLGSNMTRPSDPRSIIEAAGEARGLEVPLENLREKLPPQSSHEAVPSLGRSHRGGSMRARTPHEQCPISLGTCSEMRCSVRLFLRILLSLSLFTGVTPALQSERCPPSSCSLSLYLSQAFLQ